MRVLRFVLKWTEVWFLMCLFFLWSGNLKYWSSLFLGELCNWLDLRLISGSCFQRSKKGSCHFEFLKLVSVCVMLFVHLCSQSSLKSYLNIYVNLLIFVDFFSPVITVPYIAFFITFPLSIICTWETMLKLKFLVRILSNCLGVVILDICVMYKHIEN